MFDWIEPRREISAEERGQRQLVRIGFVMAVWAGLMLAEAILRAWPQ